jgi:heme/copper-type cytochrome/quinol oxidase subunit 4
MDEFLAIFIVGAIFCIVVFFYLVTRKEFSVSHKLFILISFIILPFIAAVIWLVMYFVKFKTRDLPNE